MNQKTIVSYSPVSLHHGQKSDPQIYIVGNSKRPVGEFVISRHKDGRTLSTYAHPIWDLTPYEANEESTKLNFYSFNDSAADDKKDAIVSDMKWLMFVVIWMFGDRQFSPGTITNYMKVVRYLASYSYKENLTVINALENREHLKRAIQGCGSTIRSMTALLGVLTQVDANHTGIRIDKKNIALAKSLSKVYEDDFKQTAPIPMRILSNLIGVFEKELDAFEKIADSFLEVAKLCQEKTMGRYYYERKKSNNADTIRRVSFAELIAEKGLTEFCAAKKITDLKFYSHSIKELQIYCKATMHTFSGMRTGEGHSIPCNGISVIAYDDGDVHLINGSTTKFNNGKNKASQWVTSEEGVRAFGLAKKIALTIYSVMGISESDIAADSKKYPLFVSTKYLGFTGENAVYSGEGKIDSFAFGSGQLNFPGDLFIEEADIVELEEIDPLRDWRSEPKFEIGSKWPLVIHQLRRSTAIYAPRSGLVTLPSLKWQLKHLTEMMSEYYTKGSVFARDILSENPDHFAADFQEGQIESQVLAYEQQVIRSSEMVFGPHGKFAQRHLIGNTSISILEIREDTWKAIKRGEFAYTETALGGCVNPNHCEIKAMRSVLSCVSCESASLKLSKIDKAVRAQQKLLGKLTEGSLAWRAEMEDLELLTAAKSRFEIMKLSQEDA